MIHQVEDFETDLEFAGFGRIEVLDGRAIELIDAILAEIVEGGVEGSDVILQLLLRIGVELRGIERD